VARAYLTNRKEKELFDLKQQIKYERHKIEEEKRQQYLNLSKEEKEARLLKGLEHYNWGSVEFNPDLGE